MDSVLILLAHSSTLIYRLRRFRAHPIHCEGLNKWYFLFTLQNFVAVHVVLNILILIFYFDDGDIIDMVCM